MMFEMIEKTKKMLEKLEVKEDEADTDKVQLMTLHSAKGLEFREVHIMDLYDGNIPHKKSRSEAEIEEERRMFYVGITRSSEKLYMYVPKEVNDTRVRPSPFIKSIV